MSKTINDYSAANSIDASADYLLIEQSSTYKRINRNTLLGLASAPLGLTDIQSPTNKTFNNTNVYTTKDGNFTLQSSGGVTKQAQFVLSSITGGQTRTVTLPDANITVVGTAATQTLTNKTLTSPTITGGTYDNGTVTVDSIAGHTVSTTGTIYGMAVTTGTIAAAGIASNAVTTVKINSAAVTADKLGTGASSATVATSETTTSTSFTTLTTTTDNVTLTIGANGLALVTLSAFCSNNTANAKCYVGVALSSGNTVAASIANAIEYQAYTANAEGQLSYTFLMTGLSAASTKFQMQYTVATGGGGAGTGTFKNRVISVVPL